MQIEDFQSTKAKLYAQYKIIGTDYLAFRDLPELIKKYSHGKKAIDYGCGCGRSTQFLKNLGLEVVGVDTSPEMLKQAETIDKQTTYRLIQSAEIPACNHFYNIAFCSLVLFEISSKTELLKIFNEIKRVIDENGIFIIVTGSEDMYRHSWYTLDASYKENRSLKSGSLAKIQLKQINLELLDYFWTDNDYQEIMKKSGLSLLEKLNPLGSKEDGYPWVSEMTVSPYVIYVLAGSSYKIKC